MSQSEVARLRAQIELECSAMALGLHGYAAVASHETINHKYNGLGQCQQQLETFVGEEEAARIVVDTYIQIMG